MAGPAARSRLTPARVATVGHNRIGQRHGVGTLRCMPVRLEGLADAVAAARLDAPSPSSLPMPAEDLVLLGEVHGVAQNASVALGLLRSLGIDTLALEWPVALDGWVERFRLTGELEVTEFDDNARAALVAGDGRISAEWLALLRRTQVRRVVLLDAHDSPPFGWSERDAAMADAVLAGVSSGERALVVAGNLHTPLTEHKHGIPMGARLTMARASVVELRLSYGVGAHWNFGERRLRGTRPARGPLGLHVNRPIPAAVPVARTGR